MAQEKDLITPRIIEEADSIIIDFGTKTWIEEDRLVEIVKNNNHHFRGQGIQELRSFLEEKEIQGVGIKEMGIKKTEVQGVFAYCASLWKANILDTTGKNRGYVEACEDFEKRIKEKAGIE